MLSYPKGILNRELQLAGTRATEGKSLNGLYKEAVQIVSECNERTRRSETLVERSVVVSLSKRSEGTSRSVYSLGYMYG